MSLFSKRLKEGRLEANLSQEKLGILAGIDEMTANSRMNHYEVGRNVPKLLLMKRIAKALNLPLSFFYAEDDEEALLLKKFYRMNQADKKRVLELIKSIDC